MDSGSVLGSGRGSFLRAATPGLMLQTDHCMESFPVGWAPTGDVFTAVRELGTT